MVTPQDLVDALACGKSACRCARATRQGKGLVHCPAHEDPGASLSVGDKQGKLVFHCMATCSQERVMEALRERGLWGAARQDRQMVEAYPYRDENGTVLYEVRRYHPKDFRPYLPGATKAGLNGTRRVLYRLPELLADPGRAVFLVEGEKDVASLVALGCIATTNAGGAEAWRDEYAQSLKSRLVYVLPDNDDAGTRWAASVAQSLVGVAKEVRVVTLANLPSKGDVSDWLAAGGSLEQLKDLVRATPVFEMSGPRAADGVRKVRVTDASEIKIRPVRWLWDGRIPLGILALLGGREGIGKSILLYTLAADMTRGRLPGVFYGTPRAVVVAATEDSWEHVIVPRLMAAEADLKLVKRVDAETAEGLDAELSLPADLPAVKELMLRIGAGLLLLDPLLSRLDSTLDTHKDAEVRRALEPLVRTIREVDAAAMGIIHVNKTASTDPLTLLMGSRAFAAVARAVLFMMLDPESETIRLLGQPKNNYGRTDLPTLTFQINNTLVAETDEGPVWTGKLEWLGETDRNVREVLADADGGAVLHQVAECADWLEDYLESAGGSAPSKTVKTDGHEAGYSVSTLKRARKRIKATAVPEGFPRQTHWKLPRSTNHPSWTNHGETEPTEPTGPTGIRDSSGTSGTSGTNPRASLDQLETAAPAV